MQFIDRQSELSRLDSLMDSAGGLAVVYGRRRIGKTRLLLEWCHRHGGLYTVGDQSSQEVQRRYFATALETVLEGFGAVTYPDWGTLLSRLAKDAARRGWRGPLVLDELPYLALSAPALPSVLQRWIDHEARDAGLAVAVSGSSQRMMHGIVLDATAPLFGRSREIFRVEPLSPAWMPAAFGHRDPREVVACYAAWGGIPRYWELAAGLANTRDALDALVLDPAGPLHREPDRLLIEELPPAADLRPLLDAIGMGAHRLSEIAGRVGAAATALSRPLHRLRDMGFVTREVPFGEPEQRSKRSLYRIADPFMRLWFKVVAPHRAHLVAAPREQRLRVLDRLWSGHVATVWEDLCRQRLPHLTGPGLPMDGHAFSPGQRWWKGKAPEWDVVSMDIAQERLLLGEAKWTSAPVDAPRLERMLAALTARPAPELRAKHRPGTEVRVLFVPDLAGGTTVPARGPRVVTARELLTETTGSRAGALADS